MWSTRKWKKLVTTGLVTWWHYKFQPTSLNWCSYKSKAISLEISPRDNTATSSVSSFRNYWSLVTTLRLVTDQLTNPTNHYFSTFSLKISITWPIWTHQKIQRLFHRSIPHTWKALNKPCALNSCVIFLMCSHSFHYESKYFINTAVCSWEF